MTYRSCYFRTGLYAVGVDIAVSAGGQIFMVFYFRRLLCTCLMLYYRLW